MDQNKIKNDYTTKQLILRYLDKYSTTKYLKYFYNMFCTITYL